MNTDRIQYYQNCVDKKIYTLISATAEDKLISDN